jgi:glutamine synthetase
MKGGDSGSLARREGRSPVVATTAADVLNFAREQGVQIVDFRFTDLLGTWQHTSKSIADVDEDTFVEGVGFDGSSIRGFRAIDESDMLLIPDPTTARIDPFTQIKTLYILCDIYDPLTMERYDRDVRGMAQRAEAYLKSTGLGDTAYMGPEPEFFVFDNVQYANTHQEAFFKVDSVEGFWNTGRDEGPNLGYKIRNKGGYYPVPPHDTLMDIRSEMMLTMGELGIPVEIHHHEVGTAGQCEIDMRFDSLLSIADKTQTYKYVVRNVASKHGKVATFMPKPIWGDNGSGMHVHQSVWQDGTNLMFEAGEYANLSEFAKFYIGGLLKHGPALLALCAPTVNSYRRLVPGFEAPVNLVYSMRNRSAAVRIPAYSRSEKGTRVEFRCPDTAANPYLCFAALLMAGLDGVKNRIDPGAPSDFDLYEADAATLATIKSTPGSLEDVLQALEADHDFLLEGGVFTKGFIEAWCDYKRTREIAPSNLRVTPYEYELYFDV